MKSTTEFYEVFSRHGFLVDAVHTSSAPPNAQTPIEVSWSAPGEIVLGDVVTTERAITFPSAALTGVRQGDTFTIDGVAYRVRSSMPRPGTDGSEQLVALALTT